MNDFYVCNQPTKISRMKKRTGVLTGVLLIVVLLSAHSTIRAQQRVRINFNADWKFLLEDKKEYCSVEFDDASWRSLDLPHDWSVEAEFSQENSGRNAWLPGGIAWYRKSFEVPEKHRDKSIQIQFDGIYKNATLWVNGHPVGVQHDGYTSFFFEITELLNVGENNTIAVRVDNSIQPNCRWYSGSGIYRNVCLIISSHTRVATWGTYITTPDITEEKASVRVVTSIENMDKAKSLSMESVVYDPEGKEVARTQSVFKVGQYRSKDIEQEMTVAKPELWSLEESNLYTLSSTIRSDQGVEDEYESKFGFRTIRFDADKGFFLNGVNMKMKGVCLHHEAGPLGAAVPAEVWERRLVNLKEIGCNAIRTAHNPPSPEFLDLCDELGFLVMDEFVDKWENPYKPKSGKANPFYDMPMADPHFSEEWQKNFRETIKRDRNHPSVIFWSVGNENHSPGFNTQNHGLKMYGSFVRDMDPTRPVISGMERGKDEAVARKVDGIIESCEFMDVIAMNYGEQWRRLIAERKPGKPFVSTESYCYYNSELEKRFSPIESAPWIDVIDNESNMGLFLWVGIDYLGESKTWPGLGSSSGLFDVAGFRKNRSFLYEAFWSESPMVHIEVYEGDADEHSPRGAWGWPSTHQNWNLEKGKIVDIATYTNCETVELYLNNKLIGSQDLADVPNWIMKWRKIGYKPGTLRAVGKINGEAVCETELHTTGKPAMLSLEVDAEHIAPNDVVHVEVRLRDKKDNLVTFDDRRLEFKLEGDGEIIGLANGDLECLDAFSNVSSRPTYRGRCLCIIRAGKLSGDGLKLSVGGEGLKTGYISLPGTEKD